MEQDTFFITEVVSEAEEKPFISNVTERIVTQRKPVNHIADRTISHCKKRRKTLKVTNVEKRQLAKLVEQETVLWDRHDELHCNNQALLAAWSRIAKRMSGRTSRFSRIYVNCTLQEQKSKFSFT